MELEVLMGISQRYNVLEESIDVSFCHATAEDERYRGSFPDDVALGNQFDVIVFAAVSNTATIPLLESLVPRLTARQDVPSAALFIEGARWIDIHLERNRYYNIFSEARALFQTDASLEPWRQLHSISPWLYGYEVLLDERYLAIDYEKLGGDNYHNVAPFAATTRESAQGNLLFYELTDKCTALLRERAEAVRTDVQLGLTADNAAAFAVAQFTTRSPRIFDMLYAIQQSSLVADDPSYTADANTPGAGLITSIGEGVLSHRGGNEPSDTSEGGIRRAIVAAPHWHGAGQPGVGLITHVSEGEANPPDHVGPLPGPGQLCHMGPLQGPGQPTKPSLESKDNQPDAGLTTSISEGDHGTMPDAGLSTSISEGNQGVNEPTDLLHRSARQQEAKPLMSASELMSSLPPVNSMRLARVSSLRPTARPMAVKRRLNFTHQGRP